LKGGTPPRSVLCREKGRKRGVLLARKGNKAGEEKEKGNIRKLLGKSENAAKGDKGGWERSEVGKRRLSVLFFARSAISHKPLTAGQK